MKKGLEFVLITQSPNLLQKEIEDMRNMFLKELKEMNEKYMSAQEAVESLQRKQGDTTSIFPLSFSFLFLCY